MCFQWLLTIDKKQIQCFLALESWVQNPLSPPQGVATESTALFFFMMKILFYSHLMQLFSDDLLKRDIARIFPTSGTYKHSSRKFPRAIPSVLRAFFPLC